ncbi:MAG: patatin-like phospholipase family protein [Candidatus Dormibacteraceae bacterium]
MNRRTPRHAGPEGGGRTAFVLSGGGSLGAVQVGMLQALTEAGIRPDLLIGTSVGAVNAAWIGGRPDHEGALRLGEIWHSLRRQHVFPLSPWSSARGLLGRSNHVISNASLGDVLRKHLPYQRLEEAAVPVHVITTELKTGRAMVMSTGPAVPALLASTAIPGIFPPVTIGRREFVDGGVANHTPIAAAVELGASRIFVLAVGYPWLRQEPTNALGMALYALARFIEQKLDAEVAAYRHLAEIQVLPTLDGPAVSPADFSHTEDLMARGYKSCRKYLEAIPQAPAARVRQLELAPAAIRAA